MLLSFTEKIKPQCSFIDSSTAGPKKKSPPKKSPPKEVEEEVEPEVAPEAKKSHPKEVSNFVFYIFSGPYHFISSVSTINF